MDKEDKSKSDDKESTECAICLQLLVQPVKLPCNHVFCFLCAKGLIRQNNKCALCRKEIPNNYMNRPQFVAQQPSGSKSYHWYYQGQSGWWQYDYQTSGQIEYAYQNDEKQLEVLIAGELYIIDFKKNKQTLKSNPIQSRHIKRDLDTSHCKGVAGVPASLSCNAPFLKSDDSLKTASPAKSKETPVLIVISDSSDSESNSSDCIIINPKSEVSEIRVNVDTSKHEDIAVPSSSYLSSCASGNSTDTTNRKTLKETPVLIVISDSSDSESEEVVISEMSDDNAPGLCSYEKMVKEDISKIVNGIRKKRSAKTAKKRELEDREEYQTKRKSRRLKNTSVEYSEKLLQKRAWKKAEHENEGMQRKLENSFGATVVQEMSQVHRRS